MVSPSYEDRICAMFDSFSKTASRNYYRDLLLDFWRDFTDGEIAERLEVTTRTVYNLRQRAYKAIRNFYER